MSVNKLDEIDKNIITMLQQDPSTTHSKIASDLSRSQPAIGSRIKKLTENGTLATQMGMDFSQVVDYFLIKVEMSCTQPEEVFKLARICPYIINVFKLSGNRNLMVLMACSNLKRLDAIIDQHFRSFEFIHNIHMDIITKIAKKMVLPFVFLIENFKHSAELCTCTKEYRWEIEHPHSNVTKSQKPSERNFHPKAVNVQ